MGKVLLKQTVLLLPELYDTFRTQLLDLTAQPNITEDQDIPGSIWFRSLLSWKLEHHMACKCSVKRVGTVVYCFGGDTFNALGISLGQARNSNSADHLLEVYA